MKNTGFRMAVLVLVSLACFYTANAQDAAKPWLDTNLPPEQRAADLVQQHDA